MDEGLLAQVKEWFERGKHDLETAKLLYKEQGYADTIAHHIQQSIEKYLKGFLVFKGIAPKKTHDLVQLIGGIIKDNPSFEEFVDFCDKATRYYLEDRYPPGPPVMYSYEEIKESLELACKLIKMLQVETEVKK